jgi:poly(A)-specific ribonuclease
MGCTLVIEHMIKLKKPIIGHYANLDLGFLYQTFIDELPETFAEFCKALKNLFPFIFDTKVVSKSVQKAMKNLRVDLSSLYDACHDSKLLGPYANIDLDAYEGDEVKHQAGYDAYITGCAFIAMMNFLEVNHDKPEQKPGKQKKPKQ